MLRLYNSSVELMIYTDGGCQPNPGAMSIGIACYAGGNLMHQISKQCGVGTSNRAELLAIKEALLWAPLDRHILLHVDSEYAEGLLSKGWLPTKNLELVAEVRNLFRRFKSLRMIRVRGHQGVKGNELADSLCWSARQQR